MVYMESLENRDQSQRSIIEINSTLSLAQSLPNVLIPVEADCEIISLTLVVCPAIFVQLTTKYQVSSTANHFGIDIIPLEC